MASVAGWRLIVDLPPLTPAVMLRRYKRFLTDVRMPNGTVRTVHCPNTGTMKSCWRPGAAVEISHSPNPKRKLAWTLERVDMGQGWIGVHTGRANPVIAEAILQGKIPELGGYASLRREVGYQDGAHRARLDIQLDDPGRKTVFIEVKNATLLEEDQIRFPDAVTARGLKHLEVLARIVAAGNRGVLLFAVNRPEGTSVSPAWDIDPRYANRLRDVQQQGVEVMAVRISHGKTSLTVAAPVPVRLEPPNPAPRF